MRLCCENFGKKSFVDSIVKEIITIERECEARSRQARINTFMFPFHNDHFYVSFGMTMNFNERNRVTIFVRLNTFS